MANTRSVSIVVCGAVMGIIVGAGAVAAVTQSGLSATISRTSAYYANTPRTSTVVRSQASKNYMYKGAPFPIHYTRRKIDKKAPVVREERITNTYPTLQETKKSSSSAVAVKLTSPCDVAKATVSSIQTTYNRYIPVTMKNTEIRMRMDAAFVDAVNQHCTVDAVVTPAIDTADHGAPPAAKINNHCEQYPKQTIRYTQCVISEQGGVTYP